GEGMSTASDKKIGGKEKGKSWKSSWHEFDESFDKMKKKFDGIDEKLVSDLDIKGEILESRMQVKETGEAFLTHKEKNGKIEHIHAVLSEGKWKKVDDEKSTPMKRKLSIVSARKATLEMKGVKEGRTSDGDKKKRVMVSKNLKKRQKLSKKNKNYSKNKSKML
ncbi:MAG: hypothetical protein QXT63_08960, partial [Thermoplasmata archaeon]